MPTIREIMGMAPVAAKTFNKVIPLDAPDPALLYGVELEIENVPNWDELSVSGMESQHDGSLRNNGREFITKPMTFSNLAYCLEKFFANAKLSDENYSERCSIHVHTNVQDMQWEQVQTLALVYQVVERLLFKWIGHDREDNIFCVPLHQTNLTYKRFDTDPSVGMFKKWEKYTALNFLPMTTIGTVEWRHMYGHCNLPVILDWCRLIGRLFSYARRVPLEQAKETILSLNTSSAYELFMFDVFGPQAALFNNIKEALEEGVLDVKYAIATKYSSKMSATIKSAVTMEFNDNNLFAQALNRAAEGPDLWEPQEVPVNPAPAVVVDDAEVRFQAGQDLLRRIQENNNRLRDLRMAQNPFARPAPIPRRRG